MAVMQISLMQIENKYNNWILKKYGKKDNFDVDEVIDISLELFRELKAN